MICEESSDLSEYDEKDETALCKKFTDLDPEVYYPDSYVKRAEGRQDFESPGSGPAERRGERARRRPRRYPGGAPTSVPHRQSIRPISSADLNLLVDSLCHHVVSILFLPSYNVGW